MSQFYDTFYSQILPNVFLSHSLDTHALPLNCLYHQNTTILVRIWIATLLLVSTYSRAPQNHCLPTTGKECYSWQKCDIQRRSHWNGASKLPVAAKKTGDWSGGWQSCDVERFPGANSSTLTIPSVQKSNEGSYRCIVSNCAGSETSEFATFTVGESQ